MTQVDARKTTLKEIEALALVREVDEIYASKGKQVVHLDLRKEMPDKAGLLGLLLGPTGNLRAPTLIIVGEVVTLRDKLRWFAEGKD